MTSVSVAFQTDKSAGEYAALGAQAEALGFDGVSAFHDLGFQPSLFALLEIARATSRVRLGAACLNPALLHPVEIAGQAAALQRASGGRAYLGLARGAWLPAIGVETASLGRLAEAVEVVRRLLTGDETPYAGAHFGLPGGFRLNDPPGEIPLLIGTWGPRGLALAAEVAHEVKLGGCANADMVRLARGRLDGAGGGRVGLVAGAVTVVDEDGAAARALARSEVAMYVDVVAALDETVTIDPEVLLDLRAALARGGDAGSRVPDELLRRFAFAGTPAEVAAHASELVAAGASRIEFGTPHGLDSCRGLELLGRKVLPALRSS